MAPRPTAKPNRTSKTLRARALSVFSYRALSVLSYGALSLVLSKDRLSVLLSKDRLSVLLSRGSLSALLTLCSSLALACPPPAELERESVQLQHIHDGDSLRLTDGRRVRLLGVNAPEIAREGQPAEPLAYKARDALRAIVKPGSELELVYDSERKDHYGRTLAYVYTDTGPSLGALLLRRGLAFHIAIPPNLALARCLAEQEAKARQAELGLWQDDTWPAKPASEMTAAGAGFQRLQGKVEDISEAGGYLWLELDGPVVLRIAKQDLKHFPNKFKESVRKEWLGREVEARGWVIDRSSSNAAKRGFKPLMLPLRAPYALTQSTD